MSLLEENYKEKNKVEDFDSKSVKINDKGRMKIKKETNISENDIEKLLNNEAHGVIMRIHPKPYPSIGWGGPNDKQHRYFSKISYEFLQPDDPYAKIDENLRQLQLYNDNDIRTFYNRDKTRNKEKQPTNRYNQYYKKGLFFYPNKDIQTRMKRESKGGKNKKKSKTTKRKNKTTKRKNIKKIKVKRKNITKKRKI